MDLRAFNALELDAVLRSLRRVALCHDQFTDAERALVEGVARLHGMEVDADGLEPIASAQVARVVVDPAKRRRAVQLAVVTALVEGAPSATAERAVRELAAALDIGDQELDELYEVAHRHALVARFDMFRRVGRFLRNAQSFPGIRKLALPLFGLDGADPELAARYRALGRCARGTLGRAVHDHFADNGFRLPGEPFGLSAVFHDLGHVLSGYGVDPHGELQQAAFQSGFARRDGFSFLLFGLLQFHLGMRATPGAAAELGRFDVALVREAYLRGAACRRDLSEGFDLFAHRHRALEEVRAELGIPPLQAVAQAS